MSNITSDEVAASGSVFAARKPNAGVVSVELGKSEQQYIARATVCKQVVTVDPFGVRRHLKGDQILGVDFVVEYPALWRSRKGGFGKLIFHMLKVVKAELEKTTKCKVCDQGAVIFRKVGINRYLATWKQVSTDENGVCNKCWEKAHPLRGAFDPVPELDDDGNPYENLWSDAVNELERIPRETLLEDPEYLATLDAQSTQEALSG